MKKMEMLNGCPFETTHELASIYAQTFTEESEFLPSTDTMKLAIGGSVNHYVDSKTWMEDTFNKMTFREFYIKNSFVALSDDLMLCINDACNTYDIRNIVELSCGTGWLSYWMIKYGLPVTKSVDSLAWGFKNVLPFVEKGDMIEFVQDHPEVEMFVLGWPNYGSENATNVWKSMRPGQYLLYIGEDRGGCTASVSFFKETDAHIVDKNVCFPYEKYPKFHGIYDAPTLYRKPETFQLKDSEEESSRLDTYTFAYDPAFDCIFGGKCDD